MESKNIDKLITALYLSQSDNREKMLSDLIKNVLFITKIPLKLESIVNQIIIEFHVEPITYEISNILELLIASNALLYNEPYYTLSEDAKQEIFKTNLKTKEESERRFQQFEKILKTLSLDDFDEKETKLLWDVFNEYLMGCFMEFGRKAIEIFLPYSAITFTREEYIHQSAIGQLESDRLKQIFKRLLLEYPNQLSNLELRYLTFLADRAERFYSLGIEKSEYQKLSSLQIKDLVVVLDTNVLYSILDLHSHPENAAVGEILKIAREKQIDIRLVYIGKTYSELAKAKLYFENNIPKDNFRPGHIKALLASNKIDAVSTEYFKGKLVNSNYPHPADRIAYAGDLLKSKGTNLYNHPFPKLDRDEEYLNTKIEDYYDFEIKYNEEAQQKGYDIRLNKADRKKEHDVYLREAVIELKKKYSNENELKFVCLTLDNSLVNFDHYMFKKSGVKAKEIINPNFLVPSVFLKKIRPFIPIISKDYRKAFITSLTSPTYSLDDKGQNKIVIKSMTYFKSLGIEDEEVLINCIKRELFLEEFSSLDSSEQIEQFILSEVGKEIKHIVEEKDKIQSQNREKEKAIEEKERLLKEREDAIFRIGAEKEKIKEENVGQIHALKEEVVNKERVIEDLSDRLIVLERLLNQQIENTEFQQREKEFSEMKTKWETDKEQYVTLKWATSVLTFQKDSLYMFRAMLIMVFPILTALVIRIYENQLTAFLSKKNIHIDFWIIYGILGVIQLIELFFRTYIANKDRVKSGWLWLIGYFFVTISKKTRNENRIKAENEFINAFPEPVKQPLS
jgi:hypothetical protein